MAQQFNFVLKKLVLVDSAGFCYSEIELDKHTILLGEGNVGKSSLLNCIRLFLLPEVNFNKAKDKFNFKSSNGYQYDKNESFSHYFPSRYSHLIIEVEKIIAGTRVTHCQILSRGKNLSFERIFTTLPFTDIQHMFWQVDEDDEHQIGSRVDKLSTEDIFAQIKTRDKFCLSVRDPQKLKELMYARDILSDVAMRYSLFPLNEISDENIESLRALILMLFDMETSTEGVAKAVANIIEAEKKETTDALNFDIQSFLSSHDSLKQEEQKLTDIENKTDVFTQLKNNVDEYSKLSEIESSFVNFYLFLRESIKEANEAVNQSGKIIKELQQQCSPITTQITTLNQSLFTARANIKSIEKSIVTSQNNINQGDAELSFYAGMTAKEALELLNEEFDNTKDKINALKDINVRRERISRLQMRLEKHEAKQKHIEMEINNSQFSLQKQLPKDTLELFNSVNQRLAVANPGKKLNLAEVEVLEGFKSLFIDQGYSYDFWGQQIDKSTATLSRNLSNELEDIKAEINADKSEKNSLEGQESESPLVIQKKLKNLDKELNDIERVRTLISKLEDNKTALRIYKEQLLDNQSTVDELSPDVEKLIAHQTELLSLIETEKQQQDLLEKKQTHLLTLQNTADGTKQVYPKIQRQLEKQKSIDGSPELTQEYLISLQRDLIQVEDLRRQIIDSLRGFSRAKFIELNEELFNSSPMPSVISQTYLNLKQIYDEFDSQRLLLRTKTKSHNESVSNYVDILDKNFEHISRFENQLNRSFKGITVNDLTEIEVAIHIDERFKNLIAEIHKSYNEFSENALSEQFYLRLQAFSDGFFKNSERNKLVMSDVIKKVSYRVKKEGHDSWQTKQQSTSTTALINLKLVRMLLAKLRADSCMVTLPVIMDEAANINVNQYEWLLEDIKNSGFFLFTAGTHSSGAELVHMIGHYYDVDALKTAKPYSAERTRVVWSGPQAFYDEEGFDAYVTDSQIELLEGVNEEI